MYRTAACNSPINQVNSQWSTRSRSKPNNLPIIRLLLLHRLWIRSSRKPRIPGLTMAFQVTICIVISIITVQMFHHTDPVQPRIIPKMKNSTNTFPQAWHRHSTITSWMNSSNISRQQLIVLLLRMSSSSNSRGRRRRLQIWIIHRWLAVTKQERMEPWIIYRWPNNSICLVNITAISSNFHQNSLHHSITSKRNITGRIRRSNTNFKIVTRNTPQPQLRVVTRPSNTRFQLWITNKEVLC